MDKQYNKILNIVLIISGVIVVVLLGFWGYNIYKKYFIKKEANKAVNEFIQDFQRDDDNIVATDDNTISLNVNDLEISNGTSTSGKIAKHTYKGYTMDGIITIPKINLRYPILDRATSDSMDVAVGINFGPGLNKVGNTVIMGHNSSNGLFFSKLSELQLNDEIYIMDYVVSTKEPGQKYLIYNIYETSSEDLDYFSRDTAGKKEISLSTCIANDTSNRLIIWAREAN